MSNSMHSISNYALAESLSPRVAEFVSLQQPPESLAFTEVMRDLKQAPPSRKGSPANPFAQLAKYLKSLPENQKVDAHALVEAARANNTYSPLEDALDDAVYVTRSGNHIEIERRESEKVPIARDILEGNVSADSLNIEKKLAFDIAADGNGIQDVHGLSLAVSAFGSAEAIRITQLDFAPDATTQPALVAHMENPLPHAAKEILSMPDTIQIPIETENGKLKLPQPSSVFHAVGNSAGDTLPGMLFSDAFQDIGDISQFAEKNPKWIHDVIKPMFDEVKRQAAKGSSNNQTDGKGAQPSGKNRDDSHTASSQSDGSSVSDQSSGDKPKELENQKKITHPGDYDQTIVIDGMERHYFLHVPPSYDGSKPIPLLLMLHGRGGDGKEFAERTHMTEKADKEGFAVAYPDATKWFGRKDLSAWDAANGLVPPGERASDLEFLRKLIDRSQSQFDVDAKRIYMIGHSSGGMMTYLAASQMSDKLAAVGIVSSAMSGKEPKPKSPVSVISTNGSDDDVIPTSGLKDVPPVLSELGIPTFNTPQFATDFWKRQNGITSSGTIKIDGDSTEKHFENTENGTAVDEITINNSGHTPDEKLHVYDKIWSFLQKHPKSSGKVAPSNDPTELLDVRPNPLRKILDNIQKRGADGIADDVAKIYTQVRDLPNGSIYPSRILNDVENKLGSKLENQGMAFIENSIELSKFGNHIELKTSKPTMFPIDESAGPGTIESLTLDNVKFNLDSNKGNPKLSNIQGVSLDFKAFRHDFRTNLHELTDKEDDKGHHTYYFNFDNPVPKPLRWLMLAPPAINVGMQVDNGGSVKVANQRELRNDLLGKNPITRGYFDEVGDFTQAIRDPESGALPAVRRDIGITSGLIGLGMFVPRYRIPISLAGGLIAAPAIIHFMHERARI